MSLSLDKRWCDLYDECANTHSTTVREWIHDIYKYIYGEDIPDSELDKMTQDELEEFVDELDWLADK